MSYFVSSPLPFYHKRILPKSMRTSIISVAVVVFAFGFAVSASQSPFERRRLKTFGGLAAAGDNFQRLANVSELLFLRKLDWLHTMFEIESCGCDAKEMEKQSHNFTAQDVEDSSSESSSSSSSSDFAPLAHSVFQHSAECGPTSAFHVAYVRAQDVCSAVDLSFVGLAFSSRSKANKSYQAFCTSPCVGSLVGFLALGVSDKCLDGETRRLLSGVLSMCQKDETGDYCGAVLFGANPMTVESVCDKDYGRNETACRAAAVDCVWCPDGCSRKVTDADLDALCGTCFRKFSMATGDGSLWNLVCPKVEGKYCFPLVQSLAFDLTDRSRLTTVDRRYSRLNAAQLDGFCLGSNASFLQICAVTLLVAEQPLWYGAAMDDWNGRVRHNMWYPADVPWYGEFPFWYDEKARCLKCDRHAAPSWERRDWYALVIREFQNAVTSMKYICSKKGKAYCVTLATATGCCLHDIAAMSEEYKLTLPDLPHDFFPSRPSSEPDFGLLSICPTSLANEVSASCILRGNRSPLLSFDIKVNYLKVSGDAALLNATLCGLAWDIARAAVLKPGQIVNITLKNSGADQGATVTFQVWAELDLETRVAITILSSLVSLKAVPLIMTEYLLATECGADCFTGWPLLYSDFRLAVEGAPNDMCMSETYFQLTTAFFHSCDPTVTRAFSKDDFENLSDAQDAWV